jgi:toxin ParE1/3/4
VHKLRFTRAASRDLDEIQEYIARDNPTAAKRFTETLIMRCRALTTTPHMGPARPDVGSDIRVLVIPRNYAILYRIEGDEVQIIRAVHTAMDIRRVLKSDC